MGADSRGGGEEYPLHEAMATRIFRSVERFEEWLMVKPEMFLRNKLYKSVGAGARMNGPKRELVRRLISATSSLSRDQFRVIFPELTSRENQGRRDLGEASSIPVPIPARPTTARREATPLNQRPRLRSRVGVAPPIQGPVRMGRLSSRRQPVSPPSQLAHPVNRQSLEISINHVIQVVPSPRPRHNSADSERITPRRPSNRESSLPRRRRASISSTQKRGLAVAVAPPRTVQSNVMECKVCFDAPIQTAILPCLCYDCSIKIQHADFEDTGRCPVCRQRMVEV